MDLINRFEDIYRECDWFKERMDYVNHNRIFNQEAEWTDRGENLSYTKDDLIYYIRGSEYDPIGFAFGDIKGNMEMIDFLFDKHNKTNIVANGPEYTVRLTIEFLNKVGAGFFMDSNNYEDA